MANTQLTKIMLVEDEPDIQMITRMSLEKIGGFEVEVCSSGMEALEKISIFNPELVLLDVMMPEMDGPTTLARIKEMEKFNDIPIAFLTAKAQSEEIRRFKELGAVDVITKPFDPMTLPVTIRELWGQYFMSCEK